MNQSLIRAGILQLEYFPNIAVPIFKLLSLYDSKQFKLKFFLHTHIIGLKLELEGGLDSLNGLGVKVEGMQFGWYHP